MTQSAQKAEVDDNYDFFMRSLAGLLPDHLGQFALLKSRSIVEFFDSPGEAYRYALREIGPLGFSIQEVTQEPIDLGLFSHVAS